MKNLLTADKELGNVLAYKNLAPEDRRRLVDDSMRQLQTFQEQQQKPINQRKQLNINYQQTNNNQFYHQQQQSYLQQGKVHQHSMDLYLPSLIILHFLLKISLKVIMMFSRCLLIAHHPPVLHNPRMKLYNQLLLLLQVQAKLHQIHWKLL